MFFINRNLLIELITSTAYFFICVIKSKSICVEKKYFFMHAFNRFIHQCFKTSLKNKK